MSGPGFKHGHGLGASQLPESLGQKTSAESVSVALASDTSIVLSAPVADPLFVRISDGANPVDMLPVSAAALPLPSGAATSANQATEISSLASIDTKLASQATAAKQDTGNTSLASIDTKLSSTATSAKQDTGNTSLASIDTKTPDLVSGRVPVDGSGVTQPVSAAALPLPTGAATEATLAAQSAKLPATLGQKAMAASLAVAIASDQGAVPVSQSGTWNVGTVASITATVANDPVAKSKRDLITYDHTVAVTTAAYTTVLAATSGTIKRLHIFDSSGSALILAVGAAASEVDTLYIPPGGFDGPVDIAIASGVRLSIKALDANTSSGRLIINALS